MERFAQRLDPQRGRQPPTVARLSDRSLVRGHLTTQQAYAALWDVDGEDLTRRLLQKWSSPDVASLDDSCKLLTLDFPRKKSHLFTLNNGFLGCDEDELRAGEARSAWMRAWQANRRVVTLSGYAMSLPPTEWTFEMTHPRQTAQVSERLIALLGDKVIEFADVCDWIGHIDAYAQTQRDSLGQVADALQAGPFLAQIERRLLAKDAPAGPAGPGIATPRSRL